MNGPLCVYWEVEEAVICGHPSCYAIARDVIEQFPDVHHYDADDRCVCGGEVVWYDSQLASDLIGNGCSIEGRPWAPSIRRLDPQERRYDAQHEAG